VTINIIQKISKICFLYQTGGAIIIR